MKHVIHFFVKAVMRAASKARCWYVSTRFFVTKDDRATGRGQHYSRCRHLIRRCCWASNDISGGALWGKRQNNHRATTSNIAPKLSRIHDGYEIYVNHGMYHKIHKYKVIMYNMYIHTCVITVIILYAHNYMSKICEGDSVTSKGRFEDTCSHQAGGTDKAEA